MVLLYAARVRVAQPNKIKCFIRLSNNTGRAGKSFRVTSNYKLNVKRDIKYIAPMYGEADAWNRVLYSKQKRFQNTRTGNKMLVTPAACTTYFKSDRIPLYSRHDDRRLSFRAFILATPSTLLSIDITPPLVAGQSLPSSSGGPKIKVGRRVCNFKVPPS